MHYFTWKLEFASTILFKIEGSIGAKSFICGRIGYLLPNSIDTEGHAHEAYVATYIKALDDKVLFKTYVFWS